MISIKIKHFSSILQNSICNLLILERILVFHADHTIQSGFFFSAPWASYTLHG